MWTCFDSFAVIIAAASLMGIAAYLLARYFCDIDDRDHQEQENNNVMDIGSLDSEMDLKRFWREFP